jgi:hypothetical protein
MTRQKLTPDNPELERTKNAATPATDSANAFGGSRGSTVANRVNETFDSGIQQLRKDGAFDIKIAHVPTGKSVSFPAMLTSFSDGVNAQFGGDSYYGRMDTAPVYSNTTRTITIGFDIISYSEGDARNNLDQMNLLQAFLYPEYGDEHGGASTIKSPPLLRVKLANLIADAVTGEGLLCYTNTVGFDPDFAQGAFQTSAGEIIPKTYTVTLSLTILHEHNLGWNSDGTFRGGAKNFPRPHITPKTTEQNPNAQGSANNVGVATGDGVIGNAPGVDGQTPPEEQSQAQSDSILRPGSSRNLSRSTGGITRMT